MPCLFCLPPVWGRNQSKLGVMWKLSLLNMHAIGQQLNFRTNQTAGMKGQNPRPRLVCRGSNGRQSHRRQRFPLERSTTGKGHMRERENTRKLSQESEGCVDETACVLCWHLSRRNETLRKVLLENNQLWGAAGAHWATLHRHSLRCYYSLVTSITHTEAEMMKWQTTIQLTWKHCCPSKQVLAFLSTTRDRPRERERKTCENLFISSGFFTALKSPTCRKVRYVFYRRGKEQRR